MAQINKKETIKIYEIVSNQRDFVSAYINKGGLITYIKDIYSSETEWIIWGSTEKFATSVGDEINDPTQGAIGQNILTLQEKERNGQLFIIERDSIGPYVLRNDSIYYIRAVGDDEKAPAVFTFKVNPTHITIQKRKLFTKLRTKGGWIFQHWGPDISEISLEGTTGNITPSGIAFRQSKIPLIGTIPLPRDLSQEIPSEENSLLLKSFKNLERIYDSDQNDDAQKRGRRLAMEFRGRIYVGHLADFFYEERGERPFQFYYKLTFLVHYEATSAESAETSSVEFAHRNEETIQILNEIRKASNEEDTTLSM